MIVKLNYDEAWQIANGHEPIYTKEVEVDLNSLSSEDRELIGKSYSGSTPAFRQLQVWLPNGQSGGFLTKVKAPAKNDQEDIVAALADIRARQAAFKPEPRGLLARIVSRYC